MAIGRCAMNSHQLAKLYSCLFSYMGKLTFRYNSFQNGKDYILSGSPEFGMIISYINKWSHGFINCTVIEGSLVFRYSSPWMSEEMWYHVPKARFLHQVLGQMVPGFSGRVWLGSSGELTEEVREESSCVFSCRKTLKSTRDSLCSWLDMCKLRGRCRTAIPGVISGRV